MKGSYNIAVSNSAVKYNLTIKRNITIIKGDSATGKTVLVDMIRNFLLNGLMRMILSTSIWISG